MNQKLISYIKNIKRIINILMIILLMILSLVVISFNKQNIELNKRNNELDASFYSQEDIINDLIKNNEDLNSDIVKLKSTNSELQEANNKSQEINGKLQNDKELLEKQIQDLHSQIDSLGSLVITPAYQDFKTYLAYRAINGQGSKQWELQQIATTNEDGIRCIDGIPLVAVGTGWGLSVGDIALVTCDNNNSFKIMVGDIKADIHTDAENKTTLGSGCRCEFIVDPDKLNPQIKALGNMALLVKYNGYVVNIEKVI